MLAAAKEKITPVLPLAARLPVNQFGFVSSNSRQGFPPEIPPCIGPSTFVSSTSHWGCAPFSCDSTVARLVGLDYFGARYFSGAQGRFTSPDEPFADQRPEDPQSWNLYAYVRDNPLVSVDPTGMFEEKNPREEPPDPIEVMLVLSVFQLMSREMQAAQQGQELLQFAWNVIGGPHDPGCMAQMIAGWGAAGATVGGTVGLGGFAFAGIGETVTVPGGAAIGTGVGAAAGGAVGMIKCVTGAGGKRVTNPKHNPNSASPEPRNAQELFDKSIADKSGVRWAKDADGTIHRFSAPSNGESHWNGSTKGPAPIRMDDIPIEIRRDLR